MTTYHQCQGGPVIEAVLMGADITFATWGSKLIELGDAQVVGIHITTAQGAGAPDHVGVLKYRMTNDPAVLGVDHATTTAITTGSELNLFETLTGLGCKFLEVWYDRTSGGVDDTLTVTVLVKKPGR